MNIYVWPISASLEQPVKLVPLTPCVIWNRPRQAHWEENNKNCWRISSKAVEICITRTTSKYIIVYHIPNKVYLCLTCTYTCKNNVNTCICGPASLGTSPPPHPMVMGLYSSAPVPTPPPCGVGGGGWWWVVVVVVEEVVYVCIWMYMYDINVYF